MQLVSINPYTEEINGTFEAIGIDRCEAAVSRARAALPSWQRLTVAQRLRFLKEIIDQLERRKPDWARLITSEMGKPIRQARSEIDKCLQLCHYYLHQAAEVLRDTLIPTEAQESYVTHEPLGVILGIMPWNYPFWQVLRFAVPTLMAGNACLLKHAFNVPVAALELERLFRDAGLPEHLFQTLLTDAATAAELIDRDRVDGVSLTGSVAAGSRIGSLAGRQIKKLVLELGGSDPFIVLDDADVRLAAEKGVQARTSNTGQSCLAAKRFIVLEAVAAEFQECFLAHLQALRIGDPREETTDLGPLARRDLVEELTAQLDDALGKGAKVAYGPRPPAGRGYFFQPAVLTQVTPAMRVLREEVFGPLAPIVIVRDEAEAVEVANATEFGLGASIWSHNLERARELSRAIEAGFIAINHIVKSDPRLPFGGVKKSGLGREMAHCGLLAFVNTKTMIIGGLDNEP